MGAAEQLDVTFREEGHARPTPGEPQGGLHTAGGQDNVRGDTRLFQNSVGN